MVREDWAPLCQALVNGMSESFNQCVTEAFVRALPQRLLAAARYVSDCINAVRDKRKAAALQHVSALLAMNENPYTQVLNPHYLYTAHVLNPLYTTTSIKPPLIHAEPLHVLYHYMFPLYVDMYCRNAVICIVCNGAADETNVEYNVMPSKYSTESPFY
jgi:hypothetical protein